MEPHGWDCHPHKGGGLRSCSLLGCVRMHPLGTTLEGEIGPPQTPDLPAPLHVRRGSIFIKSPICKAFYYCSRCAPIQRLLREQRSRSGIPCPHRLDFILGPTHVLYVSPCCLPVCLIPGFGGVHPLGGWSAQAPDY